MGKLEMIVSELSISWTAQVTVQLKYPFKLPPAEILLYIIIIIIIYGDIMRAPPKKGYRQPASPIFRQRIVYAIENGPVSSDLRGLFSEARSHSVLCVLSGEREEKQEPGVRRHEPPLEAHISHRSVGTRHMLLSPRPVRLLSTEVMRETHHSAGIRLVSVFIDGGVCGFALIIVRVRRCSSRI